MDMRMTGATNNFEPSSDLIQEDECDTLLLYLPGFTKDQLRVQLTNLGTLRISGTRPIGDNKWNSFQKNFPISANCDTNKISAKFEGGILYVRQPKLIVPAEKEVKKIVTPETVRPPTPLPKINQQGRPDKTAQLPENSDKIPNEEKSAGKKDERKYDQEKHDTVDQATGKITGDASEKAVGNTDGDVADKGTKDHDKGKNVSGNVGANLADDYNVKKGSPAAKLKMSGRMITAGLTVLLALLLGMYARNLSRSSKNPEN